VFTSLLAVHLKIFHSLSGGVFVAVKCNNGKEVSDGFGLFSLLTNSFVYSQASTLP